MQDYNKKNLKRLLALFAACLIALSAVAVFFTISGNLWPVALPSSGGAIYAAAMLFKRGYLDKDKEG